MPAPPATDLVQGELDRLIILAIVSIVTALLARLLPPPGPPGSPAQLPRGAGAVEQT